MQDRSEATAWGERPRGPVERASGTGAIAASPAAGGAREIAARLTYPLAAFLGAFLLFLVQPLFARMVLPLLGGSPAVWNSCMLFFQAALLGGYLYAHLTSRWLPARRQAVLHGVLLLAAAAALPLSLSGDPPSGMEAPLGWLLLQLLVSVGPPFLVLSATGPMVQRWFAESGRDRNPYPLYAASNLGSMLALLSYPAFFEPRLTLSDQAAAWTAGYALLGLSLAMCAWSAWRSWPRANAPTRVPAEPGPSLTRRASWVALAFVPSSMLLGATTYLTTDLAPVPLLWVLPLALYLLSFTLVFARRQPIPYAWMVAAQPILLALLAILLLDDSIRSPATGVPMHLAGLFVTAMVCHGAIARTRPHTSHLTGFYLLVALGGVLGGVFNVLVAPVIFPALWEYPLIVVIACLARPWTGVREGSEIRMAARAAAVIGALLLLTGRAAADWSPGLFAVGLLATLVLLAVALHRAPLWLAAALAVTLLIRYESTPGDGAPLVTRRTFFGHYAVTRVSGDGGYHVLTHGSTLHGAQSLDPERRHEPLTYYVSGGPLGRLFLSKGISTRDHRVAVVGLGTGATAAYGQPGEDWTFYEIDEGIERIARDTTLFTYLADSPAEIRVEIGDARISLARGGAPYDLILLDAFSSDAVPTHLLTREALRVYLARLGEGGRIAFHISNRYLDLEPVLAALAREHGLAARVGRGPEVRGGVYEQVSTWLVMARTEGELAGLQGKQWRAARTREGVGSWTDSRTSVLEVMRW